MRHLFSFLVLLLSCSCLDTSQLQPVKFSGEAQGTYYMVTYYHPNGLHLQNEMHHLLLSIDSSVSTYMAGSVISKINENDTLVEADDIFLAVYDQAYRVAEETDGAFDYTVAPLVNAWGFGFKERIELTQQRIDSIKMFVNYRLVRLNERKIIKSDPRVQIDFNAIAQGYSVDLIGELLESNGIHNYLVDIGGEVLAKGSKPDGNHWRVGIEKPSEEASDKRELKAIALLKDAALATSGSYRKYYEKDGVRYSHTINPATGYPVTHSLLSVSVMADRCMLADAYATAFMVSGFNNARKFVEARDDLEAYFIYSDSTGTLYTYATQGMRDILLREEITE